MRTSILLAFILGLGLQLTHTPGAESDLKDLYDKHCWFDLRDEITARGATAPDFYKGAIDAALNRLPEAERDLRKIIENPPSAGVELEAREQLVGLYYRRGKYYDAFSQVQSFLTIRPGQVDMVNILPTLRVLSRYNSQWVGKRSWSTIKMEIDDGNLVLPVAVNGIKGQYIFDNGFSLSAISESEAKRLHLNVQEAATNIDTMNGTPVKTHITVARRLSLGNFRLTNVAFYVLPDDAPPFDDLAAGRRGILGLPVILALQHFRWNAAKSAFTILPPNTHEEVDPNLALDGTSTLVRVLFKGKPLQFSLDLGAQKTVLYPSFARAFPDIRSSGVPEAHKVTGVGGSTEIESVKVASLTFEIANRSRSLTPAHILLQENNTTSSWLAGNLAMDLLNGSEDVEIDFGEMRLTVH